MSTDSEEMSSKEGPEATPEGTESAASGAATNQACFI